MDKQGFEVVGVAELGAGNWTTYLGPCGFNSVSYKHVSLICMRLEPDGQVAANENWNHCVSCLSLTSGRFVGTEVWGKAGMLGLNPAPFIHLKTVLRHLHEATGCFCCSVNFVLHFSCVQ